MVQITRSLLVLTSFAVSCMSAATVSNVASNIQNMLASAVSLENTFKGIDGYNWMVAGPTLHNGVSTLVSGMERCTGDIMAMSLPLSATDGAAIFNAIYPLVGLSDQFLQTLLARKTAISQLPVVGPHSAYVVRTELQTIQTSVAKLGDTLVNAAPASLANNATALKTNVDGAIASALNAYSTS